MIWLKAEYEFGSLFSYRIPGYSSQYALASPLPGPSTIKLAIVATAIEATGNITYAEEIFEIVKSATIKIARPKRIAISNCFIKRLTQRHGVKELEESFGIRGYVHLEETLKIFLSVQEAEKEKIKQILRKIRRFGTSDSLAYCITPYKEMEQEPPDNAIEAVEEIKEGETSFIIIPVKDINPKTKFENINIYASASSKNVYINKYYLIPVFCKKEGKNWKIYEISN